MKVGIGVITAGGYNDRIPTLFVWSLWALHSSLLQGILNDKLPSDQHINGFELLRSTKFPTDCARNDICQQALDKDCDALLFLDADHEFAPSLLSNLLAHRKSIVTGRYHVKQPPYHPTLYVTPTEAHTEGNFKAVHYGKGLFPVDRCGAGALLIRREALEAIGFPWFRYKADPKPPHDLSVSEDFWFCERAQEEGFTIWADWETEAKHLTQGSVGIEWQAEYLAGVEERIAGGDESLIPSLVACGFPDGLTLPSGHVIPPYEPKVSG